MTCLLCAVWQEHLKRRFWLRIRRDNYVLFFFSNFAARKKSYRLQAVRTVAKQLPISIHPRTMCWPVEFKNSAVMLGILQGRWYWRYRCTGNRETLAPVLLADTRCCLISWSRLEAKVNQHRQSSDRELSLHRAGRLKSIGAGAWIGSSNGSCCCERLIRCQMSMQLRQKFCACRRSMLWH